jgi:hypothetical protein
MLWAVTRLGTYSDFQLVLRRLEVLDGEGGASDYAEL